MSQFIAFDEHVKIKGDALLSMLAGRGVLKSRVLRMFEQNGLGSPVKGQWYSQQACLNVFKYLYENNGPNTLFSIGREIPNNAVFPPGIDSLARALSSIDVAYHMNHTGGKIGGYFYKSEEGNKGIMVCENPYPCDFDRGLIESMAKKFKPKESQTVTVKHDDSLPCRQNGADSCTYHIFW